MFIPSGFTRVVEKDAAAQRSQGEECPLSMTAAGLLGQVATSPP